MSNSEKFSCAIYFSAVPLFSNVDQVVVLSKNIFSHFKARTDVTRVQQTQADKRQIIWRTRPKNKRNKRKKCRSEKCKNGIKVLKYIRFAFEVNFVCSERCLSHFLPYLSAHTNRIFFTAFACECAK